MGDCLKHPFMDFLFWMGQDISINQIRYGQPIKNRLAIFINMDFRQYLHKVPKNKSSIPTTAESSGTLSPKSSAASIMRSAGISLVAKITDGLCSGLVLKNRRISLKVSSLVIPHPFFKDEEADNNGLCQKTGSIFVSISQGHSIRIAEAVIVQIIGTYKVGAVS